MINNSAYSAYGAPPDTSVNGALQEALHRLAALDAENHRLRLQLFDSNQQHEDVTDCYRSTEVELKYSMKKEAEKFEKELSIRVLLNIMSNQVWSGLILFQCCLFASVNYSYE